jgi:hypothetical protein
MAKELRYDDDERKDNARGFGGVEKCLTFFNDERCA